MQAIRIASAVGVVVMAAAIVYGFATASFTADGSALLDLTWGRITLVDIYVSFLVAWAWIAWREGNVGRAALWLVLVVVLGSLAITAYVLRASLRADTVEELLLGRRRATT